MQWRHLANYAGIASSPLFSKLRDHVKRRVTGQRAAGRGHGDRAVGRANGNRGFYQRVGLDCKCCGSSVDRDARGSSEPLPKQAEVFANFRRTAHKSHEGAEADVLAENRAATRDLVVAGGTAAGEGHTVEFSVCVLNQTVVRVGSIRRVPGEAIKRRRRSINGHFEYVSLFGISTLPGRPVEVSIIALRRKIRYVARVRQRGVY